MKTATLLLTKIFILTILLLSGAGWFLYHAEQEILLESIESKTAEGDPVYNKIKLISKPYQDVWLMKQSHFGVHATDEKWEDLKIVVDKTKKPYLASYYQTKNGKDVEYRASCFLCHANGPRLIRPEKIYSLPDQIVLNIYNLRIKTYGKVDTKDSPGRVVPLKHSGSIDTAPFTVKTCVFCHNSSTPWGRGELQRQHSQTIKQLVDTGAMPPWPFKISKEERETIRRFRMGF